MAWEKRSNRRYFYRKQREGRRVVSKYIGPGLIGELEAGSQQLKREAAQMDRLSREEEREHILASSREVDAVMNLVTRLARAELQAAGYHQHKGTWRKRRGKHD